MVEVVGVVDVVEVVGVVDVVEVVGVVDVMKVVGVVDVVEVVDTLAATQTSTISVGRQDTSQADSRSPAIYTQIN